MSIYWQYRVKYIADLMEDTAIVRIEAPFI